MHVPPGWGPHPNGRTRYSETPFPPFKQGGKGLPEAGKGFAGSAQLDELNQGARAAEEEGEASERSE